MLDGPVNSSLYIFTISVKFSVIFIIFDVFVDINVVCVISSLLILVPC